MRQTSTMHSGGAPLAERALPQRRRRGGSGKTASRITATVVTLGILALWEAVTRIGFLPPSIPPISAIASALVEDARGPELWSNVWLTLGEWALGLVIVFVVGVPAGMLLGSSKLAYALTQPSIEFVRTIPSTAAIPLLILIYGSGFQLAVVMVVLGSLWPILIATMYGVHDVDPVARDVARAYGISKAGQFRRIVLPSTLPYVATGTRLSATIALILAISASLIGGGNGLGAAIASASQSDANTLMYARVLVAGLMGVLVTALFVALERKLLFWHPSQRLKHV